MFYTIGGIRAVTLTDVLQFITFAIIIALLVKFMFLQTGESILESLAFLQTQKKFQFTNWFQGIKGIATELLSNGLKIKPRLREDPYHATNAKGY